MKINFWTIHLNIRYSVWNWTRLLRNDLSFIYITDISLIRYKFSVCGYNFPNFPISLSKFPKLALASLETCWVLPFECRLNYVFREIIRHGRRETVGSWALLKAGSRKLPYTHHIHVLNILFYLKQPKHCYY